MTNTCRRAQGLQLQLELELELELQLQHRQGDLRLSPKDQHLCTGARAAERRRHYSGAR